MARVGKRTRNTSAVPHAKEGADDASHRPRCRSCHARIPALGQCRREVTVGPGGGTPGTSANVELVGHEPLFSRGLNAAPAVFGDYVYVGNRTDGSSRCRWGDPGVRNADACPHPNPGVLVVDASDPSAPQVVNEIGPPYAGNVSETTRELRVWPGKNLIVESFACSSVIHSCVAGSVIPKIPVLRPLRSGQPGVRLRVGAPRNNAIRTPHEFYLWEDPEDPTGHCCGSPRRHHRPM